MLPSSGYFKSVPCPFYKSGFCERPHCHFKHARTGDAGKSYNQWIGCDEGETLSKLCTEKEVLNIPVVKPSSILKVQASKIEKNAPVVPVYKPTPISQLKPHDVDIKPSLESLNAYEVLGSRKRKKFEEYDPEEVKYSKKRVSFHLPNEGLDDDGSDVITLESSDDDLDVDSSVKFSDDDELNDDEIQICSSTETTLTTTITNNNNNTVIDTEPNIQKNDISEYSLLDKILQDVSRNEELIKNFSRPPKVTQNIDSNSTFRDTDVKQNRTNAKPYSIPSAKECIDVSNTNAEDNKVSKIDAHKDSVKTLVKSEFKEQNVPKIEEKAISIKNEKNVDDNAKCMLKNKTDEKADQDLKLKSSKEGQIKHLKDDKGSGKKSLQDEKPCDKKSKARVISDGKKTIKDAKHIKEESKTSRGDHSKSSKTDKLKSSSDRSDKIKKKVENSEPSKDKNAKESKTDKKDHSAKHSSNKDSSKHLAKEAHSKSHSSKTDKVNSKESNKKDSKHLKDGSDLKHKARSDKEKSKSSSSSSHTTKDKSSKSKSSDDKLIKHVSKSSTSHSSQSSHKSFIKNKEVKKIQDEKISSSSIIKSSKCNEDLTENESISRDLLVNLSSDSDGNSDVDDIDLNSGSEMDSDTYEECWRIFNEANEANADELKSDEKPQTPVKETSKQSLAVGKKRQAHQVEFKRNVKSPKSVEKPKLNPVQVMQNRYLKLQEMYARQNEQNQDTSSFLNSINKSASDGTKKRITAAPSSSLIAAVSLRNKLLTAGQSSSSSSALSHTVATTIKGEKRVAHVPTVAMSPRPIIPITYGSKVPSNIRQRSLNSFIDECLKFCLSEEQAYEMGLEEEKRAYDRCTNKTIYLNVVANALNRLRHRAREGPPAGLPDEVGIRPMVSSTTSAAEPAAFASKTVSHEMMLAGARAQKVTYSIGRKKTNVPEIPIRGTLLYNHLSEYTLTEEQLVANGFPLPHPTDPGRAVISGCYANKQVQPSDPFMRICSRCKKTYYVDEDGDYVRSDECDFHWGRIFKRRIAGSLEARYICCQGDAESDGCCVGPGHVFEGSDNHILKGFVKTLPKTPPVDKYYGVYSLDCEMCYTTAGIELTRVTVIGPDMKPVFETFVKPEHRVLDYNTRFSGITEENLANVSTTIRDVQAILLCMFNDKTILIGHSLESDFKALKLIHKTVVDTSVVFPHKLGLPYKRALRTLIAEKCNKIIQNSVEGHDSHEDAAACMELMLWKIKEDLKSPR